MGWSTYVGAIHRHGVTRFYLQRVDDSLDGPHIVLRRASGAVRLYASDAEAETEARALEEPLRGQFREPDDFDAVERWCAEPRVETLDYGRLMSAWHTLAHLGALREPPIAADSSEPDYALSEVADKVHVGYDIAANPRSTFSAPTWTAADLSLLATTLSGGLRRLDTLLR